MNIRRCLILFVIISFHAQADDMSDSYNRAKSNSSDYGQKAMTIMKTTPIDDIPGYHGKNVQEINYASKMTTQESAKAFALSDPNVMAEYDSAKNTLNTRDPVNNELMQEAENIALKSENHMNGSGFCTGGACQDLVDVPNNEMIQTTAILEDVLGGGQSYSQSGKEARIYSGKQEKCKKDNWGFADCCTDEGWGVDLNLANCPKETKDLGEKKQKGLCHYVGKYKEKKRVGGVVVKVDEYKGYCCYPSKMARITQEGAKPQLGLSWGSAKRPSCQGLTSNQFGSLDFSRIDMTEVYGDIAKEVVEPSVNEMLEKPKQYYKEEGIASW